MKLSKNTCDLKEILINFLCASVLGLFTGCTVFCFKYISSYLIRLSGNCYSFSKENPKFFVLFLLAVALLSLVAFYLVKWEPLAKGGGVATAILSIKGYISLKWLRNLLAVFVSASISFFAGLPLGNEGPSVQIGTNIGKGTAILFRRKTDKEQREFMALGALSGFASATFAPISALFFAFEEIKLKFSFLRLSLLFVSVTVSTAANFILSKIFGSSPYLFNFKITYNLPTRYILIAVVIGIICGLFAILVTKLHLIIFDFVNIKLKKVTLKLKFLILFILVFVSGFFLSEILGSGHSLIELLVEKNLALYLSLLVLSLRLIFLMFLNSAGVTGGLFLPNLALGALIGSVISNLFVSAGILEEKFVPIIIIISSVTFLAAVLKAPITAIFIFVEALGGICNILPISLAVLISFLVVKIFKFKSYNEVFFERSEKAGRPF